MESAGLRTDGKKQMMVFAPLPSLDSSLSLEAEGQSRKTFLLWTEENKFRQIRGLQTRRDVCRREKGDREEKAYTLEKVLRSPRSVQRL